MQKQSNKQQQKEKREWKFVVMCHMQLVEKCVNNMKFFYSVHNCFNSHIYL